MEGWKHAELTVPLSDELCSVLLFKLCSILLKNVSSKQSLCIGGTAAEVCGKCTDKRSIFLVQHSVAQDKSSGRASGLVIDVVFNAFSFTCVFVCLVVAKGTAISLPVFILMIPADLSVSLSLSDLCIPADLYIRAMLSHFCPSR